MKEILIALITICMPIIYKEYVRRSEAKEKG